MPVQLRILAIILAISFFIFTVRLIQKDRAEVRHMIKWLILAFFILVGSIFPSIGVQVAHILGIKTLTSLALFILVGLLLIISIRYQMSLISAEKQLKNLVQEISLLKKRVHELEDREKNNQ